MYSIEPWCLRVRSLRSWELYGDFEIACLLVLCSYSCLLKAACLTFG